MRRRTNGEIRKETRQEIMREVSVDFLLVREGGLVLKNLVGRRVSRRRELKDRALGVLVYHQSFHLVLRVPKVDHLLAKPLFAKAEGFERLRRSLAYLFAQAGADFLSLVIGEISPLARMSSEREAGRQSSKGEVTLGKTNHAHCLDRQPTAVEQSAPDSRGIF